MSTQPTRVRKMGARNLQRAMPSGLALNQTSKDWTKFMLQQVNWAGEFQQAMAQLNSITTDVVSASQAQAGSLLELMGHSIRAKAGLLRQASAAAQASSLPGSLSQWMSFWTAASLLASSNANAVVQINGAALTSFFRAGYRGPK